MFRSELLLGAHDDASGARAAPPQPRSRPGVSSSVNPGSSTLPVPAAARALSAAPTSRDAHSVDDAAATHRMQAALAARDLLAPPLPAAGSGVAVPQLGRDLHHALQAAVPLVATLPPYAVAAILGVPLRRLDSLSAVDVAVTVMRHITSWSIGQVRQAAATWKRMLAFAESRGELREHGGRMDGALVYAFLENVEAEARASPRRRAQAPAEVAGFPRPPLRVPGSSAAPSALVTLSFIQRNLGVDIAVDTPVVRRRWPQGASKAQSAPSCSLSLHIVAALEHAASHDPSQFVRGQAAGFVAQILSGSRKAQMDRAAFTGGGDGSRRDAITERDKHPRARDGLTRPFWVPTRGILEDDYLAAMDDMLSGIREATFFVRDTDSPNGDPRHATAWANHACVEGRALASLRALIAHATGMPASEAAYYGTSSARHFLPIIAMLQGEPSDIVIELGRWTGSAAASQGLLPAQAAMESHTRRASAMPVVYARAVVPVIVAGAIERQLKACREIVANTPHGWRGLPRHGGFELFGVARGVVPAHGDDSNNATAA